MEISLTNLEEYGAEEVSNTKLIEGGQVSHVTRS